MCIRDSAHTVFNIAMTLIWIPLIAVMVKIVMKIIPDQKSVRLNPARPIHIDDKMISQPVAALQLIAGEVLHCSEIAEEMLQKVMIALRDGDKKQLEKISEKGEFVRNISEKMSGYLAELFSAGVMTEAQAAQTVHLTYILNDLDRMAGLCLSLIHILKKLD